MKLVDFPGVIAGWGLMTSKEKWNSVAKYQTRKAKKREYDRNRKNRSGKKKAVEFIPPSGYYQGQTLAKMHNIGYSSLKRYAAKGLLRSYRVGTNVAYCEYDLIIAIENGKEVKRQNGLRLKNKS